jgi:hypothetical protein
MYPARRLAAPFDFVLGRDRKKKRQLGLPAASRLPHVGSIGAHYAVVALRRRNCARLPDKVAAGDRWPLQ